MRALLQRVTAARVSIDGQIVGEIGRGWAILLGVGHADDETTAHRLAEKVALLRAFEDAHGKTNLAAADVDAEILVVSQFTLYADTSRGRRPSFVNAAAPEKAEALVNRFVDSLRDRGFKVATGRFGAYMKVEIENDGPFTIALAWPPDERLWGL